MRTSLIPVIGLLLALAAAACTSDTTRVDATGPNAGTATGTADADGATRTDLTDADILRVFMVSNEAEIQTSQPVAGNANNPEVRSFAERMVREHEQVLERARGLQLQPRDNAVSESMTQMVRGVRSQLESASGADRDARYMEAQVILHGQTLNMLDHVLIPNAQNAELRGQLEQARPSVEAHLREAQQIHRRLAPAGAAPAGQGAMPGMTAPGMTAPGTTTPGTTAPGTTAPGTTAPGTQGAGTQGGTQQGAGTQGTGTQGAGTQQGTGTTPPQP